MDLRSIDVEGPDRRYRMSYAVFGDDRADRTVICVHGLTRNGRDFDALAAALSGTARVICPDVVGRGQSEWLDDPDSYALPTYASHMLQLIQHLGAAEVDWIGTSMGGMIGMAVASMEASPIKRLVLNDVGPFLPRQALGRIGTYLGLDLVFEDLAGLEQHLRLIHAPFGPLADEQWAHLARFSARTRADGKVVLGYDPKIATPFNKGEPEDVDLWAVWDQIGCPTLVMRGAESDLLLKETALAMTRRGPQATLIEIDGVGHAPALMDRAQIRQIQAWLGAGSTG
jgi:pimeloyl-ACP methyl ester carboxylesterase